MATAKIHRILSTLGPPHRESPGRSSPCALPGLAHLTIEADPLSALQCALRTMPKDGRLLIYGSLFLLGSLRAHWHSEPRDPVALSDPGPKPSAAPLPHDRQ